MFGITYRIEYDYIPSIIMWITSGGVLEVEQISTLDSTTCPEKVEPFVCFWKTLLIVSKVAFVYSAEKSRWRESKQCAVQTNATLEPIRSVSIKQTNSNTSSGIVVPSRVEICSTSSTPPLAIHVKMEGIYSYPILYLIPYNVWNGIGPVGQFSKNLWNIKKKL